MKTLIVQGLCENNVGPNQLKNFWYPCMATVKRWAKNREFDYKYFSDKVNNDFNIKSLNIKTKDNGYHNQTTQNQFYKFQWMNGWSDYDHVFWVDSDCYVWGDPTIFRLGWFHRPTLYFLHNNKRYVARWYRPNMSLWGGNQELVQEAIDWVRYQFEHPNDQHEIVQTLCCLNKYPKSDDSLLDITEEVFMMGYTHSRINKSVKLFKEGTDFSALGSHEMTWKPNTFIHMSGFSKQRQLNKFRAYIAYLKFLNHSIEPDFNDTDYDPTFDQDQNYL